MRYRTILIDLDNTLFDSRTSLDEIIHSFFGEGDSPAIHADFRRCNRASLNRMARGELTRPQLRADAFTALGKLHPLPDTPERLGARYEEALSCAVLMYPDAREGLQRLCDAGLRVFIASNGAERTQRRRLALTGLDGLVQDCFTWDALGVGKPEPAFFARALAMAGESEPACALMIGDEEKADIQGALGAGLDSALLHYGKAAPETTAATYVAPTLTALVDMLER